MNKYLLLIIFVTGRPWENRLNWIPDPAPATSRDHGMEQSPLSTGPEGPKEEKENRPPASHPPRIPRKMRPRRRKQTQQKHHLPGTNENSPGTDLRPRWMKRTPQKHPQHPQHPLPVTANENSPGANLWNQVAPGRLYKQAQGSRVKQSSKRPRRDYFSGSPLPPQLQAASLRLLLRDLAKSLQRPCYGVIASATDPSRLYLRVISSGWASRRSYLPPSERLPLGVPSPAVTPTLSLS